MFKFGDDDVPDYAHSTQEEQSPADFKNLRMRYYRSIISFWIFGVCNNFGFVAMLTGAENIIQENMPSEQNITVIATRECTIHSTGIVLLVQLVPATLATLLFPFVPMLIHLRVVILLLMNISGFLLVGIIKNSLYVVLFGVAIVSISCSLGEITFLQYAAYFSRTVVSTWSSGTGGAGVIAALSYTLGVQQSFRKTILAMVTIPVVMGVVFWFVLPVPNEEDKKTVAIQRNWNEKEVGSPLEVLVKKSHLIPKVVHKYMVPLGLVYLFEYFINQGTYELIKIEDSLLQKHVQYQWLHVAYQIGVFISRSSVNCIYVQCLWVFVICQFINVILFTTDAIYWYIGNYWIVFILAVEEGMFGGGAYVNTFVKIGREEEEEDKQFMSSITCFGNSLGIMSAGLLAILAHNLICRLPPPSHM